MNTTTATLVARNSPLGRQARGRAVRPRKLPRRGNRNAAKMLNPLFGDSHQRFVPLNVVGALDHPRENCLISHVLYVYRGPRYADWQKCQFRLSLFSTTLPLLIKCK